MVWASRSDSAQGGSACLPEPIPWHLALPFTLQSSSQYVLWR